jgi:hypothetical protein
VLDALAHPVDSHTKKKQEKETDKVIKVGTQANRQSRELDHKTEDHGSKMADSPEDRMKLHKNGRFAIH